MTRFVLIIGLILALFGDCTAFARSSGSSHSSGGSYSSDKTVSVRGHTTKNGTYFAPYMRHAPGTANHARASANVSPARHAQFYTAHLSSGFVGARDSHGRIIRSEAAKHEFMQMTGFPHGRPGYVIDHVIALKRGGPDNPSNMQWQTIEEAKAKDRWE
jgi:hypothetical protein